MTSNTFVPNLNVLSALAKGHDPEKEETFVLITQKTEGELNGADMKQTPVRCKYSELPKAFEMVGGVPVGVLSETLLNEFSALVQGFNKAVSA